MRTGAARSSREEAAVCLAPTAGAGIGGFTLDLFRTFQGAKEPKGKGPPRVVFPFVPMPLKLASETSLLG